MDRLLKISRITCLIMLFITYNSCDNDDGNAPNQNVCVYQGLTFEDPNGMVITQIPESQLQTDFFPNNNGPGMAAVEIFETSSPGNTFIVTDAVTLNAVDNSPQIIINGTSYTGVVTCQKAGSVVGDELRLDVVLSNNAEAELCVIIDTVTP